MRYLKHFDYSRTMLLGAINHLYWSICARKQHRNANSLSQHCLWFGCAALTDWKWCQFLCLQLEWFGYSYTCYNHVFYNFIILKRCTMSQVLQNIFMREKNNVRRNLTAKMNIRYYTVQLTVEFKCILMATFSVREKREKRGENCQKK